MANGREVSSAWWMGVFVLLLGVAGSAYLLAGEVGAIAASAPVAGGKALPLKKLDFRKRGEKLFARNCAACHGEAGRGGIANENYVKETVPALDKLTAGSGGKSLGIFSQEDAGKIVAALRRGERFESLQGKLDVASFPAVKAQHENLRNTIRNGNPAGKKDPRGATPPLNMPSWKGVISEKDIDAILAYVLTVQKWEKDE